MSPALGLESRHQTQPPPHVWKILMLPAELTPQPNKLNFPFFRQQAPDHRETYSTQVLSFWMNKLTQDDQATSLLGL